MIQAMAKHIIAVLEKKNAIRPQERDIYLYGCDITLYTVLSTLGLIVLGILGGRFGEACICISVFYLNQSVGGGYHAQTHMTCFTTMAVGLIAFILSFRLRIPRNVYILLGYLSIVVLFCIALVLHKNKSYLENQRGKLEIRSRMVTLLEFFVFTLVAIFFEDWVCHSFGMALTLCAVSRCTAKVKLNASNIPDS